MKYCDIKLTTIVHKIRMVILIVALSIVMAGCVTASPHEIFKDALYGKHPWPPRIGHNIDNIERGSLPAPENLIAVHHLPNGNIEMEYGHLWACRYFYEIDSKTRKIVGARFEGGEDNCVWIP